MGLSRDKNKLDVYVELRKQKLFVGILQQQDSFPQYVFIYDKRYAHSNRPLALGPDLPVTKIRHESEFLFESFQDRIPSRKNPAYKDYCQQVGIEVTEQNFIILLGTIGRRGPSSFVFESVLYDDFDVIKKLKDFRQRTGLSLRDISLAFGLNSVTLQRIEAGQSKDRNVIRLIRIYMEHPDCLQFQLRLSARYLHHKVIDTLYDEMERVSDEIQTVYGEVAGAHVHT